MSDYWSVQRALNYVPGPMGLDERATAAFIPANMQAAWDAYWKLTRAGERPLEVIPGGWMTRTGENSAVYAREGYVIFGLSRTTNLNWIAHQDEKIAAKWKEIYGFEPVEL